MPITIRDVAKAAGVSPMSVSRVLHGRGANVRVSEETAELIRKVAIELDYHPNALARSFRQRRTKAISLVFEAMPEIGAGSRYFSDLLDGVTTASFQRGYSVTLCSSMMGPSALTSFRDGRFDGLIWCRNSQDIELLTAIERSQLPVVVLHELPSGREETMSHVIWDNRAASASAVEHLLGLGHKRIVFVISTTGLQNTESHIRFDAFRQAMQDAGLPIELRDRVIWSDDCREFADWWATKPPHTAAIVWNEAVAGAFLLQAKAAGVTVPADISVISYDSTSGCEMMVPRLTALRQPLVEMAAKAATMLIDHLESETFVANHVVYPCRLDLRSSTGVPRPTLP